MIFLQTGENLLAVMKKKKQSLKKKKNRSKGKKKAFKISPSSASAVRLALSGYPFAGLTKRKKKRGRRKKHFFK